ncbi:prepilin-type N-terminal cleavage/methylation domain-containing protein [Mariniblastus sp.]|nr:prepilin-type N-terminal cleavage/methylation domain-containing protein [Mariniblastus sp.]
MNTPQVKTRTNSVRRATSSVHRAAFTLVELMVVILIIGILVGIATPVIFRAMAASKELTVINEVQQMNAATEAFKTKYGFYPPAFGPGLEIDTSNSAAGVAAFNRYLTRIAPNHAEVSSGGLLAWWTNVGINLDERSSLVFWLSGLCTSKQFPLSGSGALVTAGSSLAPYNANVLLDDVTTPGATIDRNVFYEFNNGQLTSLLDPTGAPIVPGIKGYNQAQGKGEGDALAFHYRDFKSYAAGASPAYHYQDPTTGAVTFLNPTSVQIVGPGLDGVLAEQPNTNLVGSSDPTQDDNITNFSNGRLEKSFE